MRARQPEYCYWYYEYQDMNATVEVCSYIHKNYKCPCKQDIHVNECEKYIDKEYADKIIRVISDKKPKG